MEPTGNSVQSRSSYLPNEVLWGHHFENMVGYSKKRGTYVIDCSNLNAVTPDNTPRMSRQDFEQKSTESKKSNNHVSRVQIDNSMSSETIATSPTCSTDVE